MRYHIGLTLVSRNKIKKLNSKYRKIDQPTDVLSFNLNEPLGKDEVYLGDIVVSPEQAKKQAREHNVSLEQEFGELVKHGAMHLLGWEHESFLLFGLGNPDTKFTHTRHNAGHTIVDLLKKEDIAGFELFTNKKKPMNEAGGEVRKKVEQNNVSLDKLVVVHDDMDIPLGEFRLQRNRGPAGHNGVASVIDALGSKDFWRLRVGVGRPPVGIDPSDYVLEKFSRREQAVLEGLVPLIKDVLQKIPPAKI
ncbi:MAG: aminoacyl-tRNA hydrolase [bacterium]